MRSSTLLPTVCLYLVFLIATAWSLTCGEGCIKCNENDLCTKCDQYLQLVDGKCQQCSPGTYFSSRSDQCLECFEFCQTCNGPSITDCLSCMPGFTRSTYKSSDVNYFTYLYDTICIPCVDDHCISCSNYVDCDNCAPGYYYNNDISRCKSCATENCSECLPDGKICSLCLPGFKKMDGAGTKCVQESNCFTNEYSVMTDQNTKPTCIMCNYQCASCKSADFCYTCSDGYYISFPDSEHNTGVCSKCDKQCTTCQTYGDFCLTCKEGYTWEGSCYYDCPPTMFANDDDVCETCLDNCLDCRDGKTCDQCLYPQQFQLQNEKCVRLCPSGQYEYYESLLERVEKQTGIAIDENGRVITVNQRLLAASSTDADPKMSDKEKEDFKKFVDQLYINLEYWDQGRHHDRDIECKPCDASCDQCVWIAQICLKCSGGKVFNPRSYLCEPICDDDQYTVLDEWKQATCVECVRPCIECTYDTCKKCTSPFVVENGQCSAAGVYQALDGDCEQDQYMLTNLCVNECPTGMVTVNDPNICQCHETCDDCYWNPNNSVVDCITCRTKSSIIDGYQCVEQCLAPKLVSEMAIDPENDKEEVITRLVCVSKCPEGRLISWEVIDGVYNWYCVYQCDSGAKERQQGNLCVHDLCDQGYYADFTKVKQEDLADLTKLAAIFSNGDLCLRCAHNCARCTDTACQRCIAGAEQDAFGVCNLKCQDYETLTKGDVSDTCTNCLVGCTVCNQNDGLALLEGNCVENCPFGTSEQDGVCKEGFGEQIHYKGQGNFNRISAQQKMWVVYVVTGIQGNSVTIDSINCTLYQDTNKTLEFILATNKTVSLDADKEEYRLTFAIISGTIERGVTINTTCLSNYTYEVNGTQTTYLGQASQQIQTIPYLVLNPRLIRIWLESFSPYLGYSRRQFRKLRDNYDNDRDNDPNEYLDGSEEISDNEYLPLNFELTALVNGNYETIWTEDAWDELEGYFDDIHWFKRDGANLTNFTLLVSNNWVVDSLIFDFNFTVGSFKPDKALDELDDPDQKKKGLNNIALFAKSLQSSSSDSDCEHGTRQGNVCKCFDAYVGIHCNLDKKSTKENCKKIFTSLIGLLQSDTPSSPEDLEQISGVVQDLASIPGIADPEVVDQQIDILEGLNNQNASLTETATDSMLNASQSTAEQLEYLSAGQSRRMLLIDQEEQQIKFNTVFQKTLINAHGKMIGNNHYYKKMIFVNSEIILSVVNISTSNSILKLTDCDLKVNSKVVNQSVTSGETIPLFFVRIPTPDYKNTCPDINASASSYQVNISSSTYEPMFGQGLTEDPVIELTYSNAWRDAICIYCDNVMWSWSWSDLYYDDHFYDDNDGEGEGQREKRDKHEGGSLTCKSKHLTDFTYGKYNQGFDPEIRYSNRQDNSEVGLVNLIVVFLVYLISMFVMCCLGDKEDNRRKASQVLDGPIELANYSPEKNGFADDEKPPKPEGETPTNNNQNEEAKLPETNQPPQAGEALMKAYSNQTSNISETPTTIDPILEPSLLQNWIFNIFPRKKFDYSSRRVEVIFLWITSYQLAFGILFRAKDDHIGGKREVALLAVGTFFIGNLLQYFYAMVVQLGYTNKECFVKCRRVFCFLVILGNLIAVIFCYRGQSESLRWMHLGITLGMILGDMMVFGAFVEMIRNKCSQTSTSGMPGRLVRLRKYKLMESNLN